MSTTLSLNATTSYLALEMLQSDLQGLSTQGAVEAGLESFRILTKIADVFGRLLNNIRAVALSPFLKFVRSELREYNDSHALAVRQMLGRPTLNLRGVNIPAPDGLKVGYLEAVDELSTALGRVKIASTLQAIEHYFKLYTQHAPDTFTTLTGETKAATQAIANVTQASIEGSMRALYEPNKRAREVPAAELIASTAEVRTLNDRILGFEKHYKEASANAKRVAVIETTIDHLIGKLNAVKTIEPAYLEALHEFVHTAAVQLDMYGVVLHQMQSLEHNFRVGFARLVEYHLAVD